MARRRINPVDRQRSHLERRDCLWQQQRQLALLQKKAFFEIGSSANGATYQGADPLQAQSQPQPQAQPQYRNGKTNKKINSKKKKSHLLQDRSQNQDPLPILELRTNKKKKQHPHRQIFLKNNRNNGASSNGSNCVTATTPNQRKKRKLSALTTTSAPTAATATVITPSPGPENDEESPPNKRRRNVPARRFDFESSTYIGEDRQQQQQQHQYQPNHVVNHDKRKRKVPDWFNPAPDDDGSVETAETTSANSKEEASEGSSVFLLEDSTQDSYGVDEGEGGYCESGPVFRATRRRSPPRPPEPRLQRRRSSARLREKGTRAPKRHHRRAPSRQVSLSESDNQEEQASSSSISNASTAAGFFENEDEEKVKESDFDGEEDEEEILLKIEKVALALLKQHGKQANKEGSILRQLPPKYKDRFQQIGFARWNKTFLPVLVINPFQATETIRNQWLKEFQKAKQAKRLDRMPLLVYWYGDLCTFSFVPIKNFRAYEQATKLGLQILPDAVQRKLERGNAALAKHESILVNGLEEMKEDLVKAPCKRKRGTVEFVAN